MPHIRFDNVSKVYTRQSRQFLWRFILQIVGRNRNKVVRAVQDLSFDVDNGESVAIVGHNGAGKSTILNLVAGITRPEQGRVKVDGRVMALLELGSGFHHDLTGAENLRLNAALCGFTKTETSVLFDRIVEFAEIDDFIFEPLRSYSQGMILRLAFSIAVHVDPDILLLDEVLVVGDQDFQQKCLDRIMQMKHEGKILLCVSHVPSMLRQLCDRALWVEHGKMVQQGTAEEVLAAYEATKKPGTP